VGSDARKAGGVRKVWSDMSEKGHVRGFRSDAGNLCVFCSHIELDRSHWEKRRQLVDEEANRRAATFIAKKKLLTSQLSQVEVNHAVCVCMCVCVYVCVCVCEDVCG